MSCLWDFHRKIALVSIYKALVSKKIYWWDEEEQELSPIRLWQIHLALDSARQIVNSTNRGPMENPGASLKCKVWSISFNHQ